MTTLAPHRPELRPTADGRPALTDRATVLEVRRRGDRLTDVPRSPLLTFVASSVLALLSVIQWRNHALTYLAGGPAIVILTGVLLHFWSTGHGTVSARMRRPDRSLLEGATR